MKELVAEVGDIVDLNVVPWGNAQEKGKTVQCQHGPNECAADIVENCAIAQGPGYFGFIDCFESAYANNWRTGSLKPMYAAAAKCASSNNIDVSKLKACYAGPEGKKLQAAAAKATNSLNPPHQYTPWVTIDGKNQNLNSPKWSLLSAVCSAYQGPKPAACSKVEAPKPAIELEPAPLRDVDESITTLSLSPAFLKSFANATNYGDPLSGKCLPGELAVQIQGLSGAFCSPSCSASAACPTDVPAGTTATPQCALETAGKSSPTNCALICSQSLPIPDDASDSCPAKASCKAIGGVGICTYNN